MSGGKQAGIVGSGRLQVLLAPHKVTKDGDVKKNDNGYDFDFAKKQVVMAGKSPPVTLKLKPWRQLLRGTSHQK